MSNVFTYFIFSSGLNEWKIGKTSNLPSRMDAILPMCRGDLVALFREEDWSESEAHGQFAALRVRREWFTADAAIPDALNDRREKNLVSEQTSDPAKIAALWRSIYSPSMMELDEDWPIEDWSPFQVVTDTGLRLIVRPDNSAAARRPLKVNEVIEVAAIRKRQPLCIPQGHEGG